VQDSGKHHWNLWAILVTCAIYKRMLENRREKGGYLYSIPFLCPHFHPCLGNLYVFVSMNHECSTGMPREKKSTNVRTYDQQQHPKFQNIFHFVCNARNLADKSKVFYAQQCFKERYDLLNAKLQRAKKVTLQPRYLCSQRVSSISLARASPCIIQRLTCKVCS
jgi:hypothetical protein